MEIAGFIIFCLILGGLIVVLLRWGYTVWENRQTNKAEVTWTSTEPIGHITELSFGPDGITAVGQLNELGKSVVHPKPKEESTMQWTMPIESHLSEVFEESNLVKHARVELEKLGEDQDTIDWFARVIGEYSSFGHSGGSHYAILPMLNDLLNFRNLMPLTDDPDEWFWHGDEIAGPGGIWQNKRCGSCFSSDGGKTYWDLDDGGKDVIHFAQNHLEYWPDDHYWHSRTGRYYKNGTFPIPRDAKGRFMKVQPD